MSSTTINDRTPLSQITSQLVAAEAYACQSGRAYGFPTLDAEREDQILGHLRSTLKSRNKQIQIGLLEKYRRICANSPSGCPPLPITGIKACLAILKIIKPSTRPDAIERLANVFESWRTLLLDDTGPVIAGIDSIWKCKALRQLVGQTASVKSRNSSVSQSTTTNRAAEQPAHVSRPSSPQATLANRSLPVSPPALQDSADDPDPLPSTALISSKGLQTTCQADANIVQVRGTTSVAMISAKSLSQQAPVTSPKVSKQPTNVGRTTPNDTSTTTPSVDKRQSTLPDSSSRIQTGPPSAAQSSKEKPTLSLAQPSVPSCGDVVRPCDDALTEHLNWCLIPAPFGISLVSPYIPDPSSSTHRLSFKHLTIPAPTVASFPNYIPVFSSPHFPPQHPPPVLTVLPLPPSTVKRSHPTTGPTPDSLGRPTPGEAERSQRIDSVYKKVDSTKSSGQQTPTITTCVAPSPPALDTGYSQQNCTPALSPTINAPALASSSRTAEIKTRQTLEPLATMLPDLPFPTETRSSLASSSTTGTRNPPPPPASAKRHTSSLKESTTPLLVDPAITLLPPPTNRHTFTEEQKTKFASVYSRATFSERNKMVSLLKDYGFGDAIHNILEPFRQSADSVQPTPIQKDIPPPGVATPSQSATPLPNVSHDPVTVPVPSTSRDPSLLPPTPGLHSHISPTLRHLKPLPVTKQSSNTSTQTSDPRSTTPLASTLDPKMAKMLQAMFNRGPQPLPVLFNTFTKLNVTNKDLIIHHIKVLAYPITGAVDGLWALRPTMANPNGMGGAPKITNPAQRPSLGIAVTSVDSSYRPDTRTKPTSPLPASSLARALRTGFPINQLINTGSQQSKAPSTSSAPQAVTTPGNAQNVSTNTQVLVISENSISGTGQKRSLPSDHDELDTTDTWTNTTQGSPAVIAPDLMAKHDSLRTERSIRPRLDTPLIIEPGLALQNLKSNVNNDSRQSSPVALKQSSIIMNDRVHRLRSEIPSTAAPELQRESRNARSKVSKTHVLKRPSPPALKQQPLEQLEPFQDDLPGYPAVDRTIQKPGTRARILAKYREDEQMAPLRTFVPILSTVRQR
ncbi:uncharacterized protein MELLADRAFT_115530 [Melampsora larici-populina 98AG31]|uniref:Uncharacterized protein n=1 Tax=Melampsora larici-populina (strain 98AG31 / pathotype 3-4-7) TaxID=747676 RepID=F4RBD3_MELLP|nr:uncharacterized protein MELLADRAFT_115530 [Melampsora larici-populina 98AG31]EGG10380.1 hypothetical protein MELLADRAFT_115530 [Melampsora larici-populina 98AG31]